MTANTVLAAARRLQRRPDRGYTGYFADPDGFRWEIAYNPEQSLAAIVLPD